ncbi:MAG TPA: ABC transporter ATP-binding protein [Candidatus Fournierella merdigallinarum]|nr:ABC transporter ATP-binding protein [Candidatus Fournierella merdigallinarum]
MGNAVEVHGLGKMYKLFDKQSDRIWDIFGLDKLRFWDREPKYREFWALRNVDLVVPKGERIGIIGRNGAGKSTLLKLIVGNLKPTEGSITVNGKIQALLQMGTGFHPEFTGVENIRAALAYAGMEPRKIRDSVDEIIEFSELEDYIHQPVKYYSAGMYSRLAFAVSTALEPDILIIDEVLGAGDAAFTSKCAERMKRLTQDSGATVLFVSHSMDSVLEICDRAILLERGEITHEGTSLEVSKIYNKKIREEEEMRARAKEFRVRHKDMVNIAQADESTQVILFHFVCDGKHPRYSHPVSGCELLCQDKTVSELRPGAPTDDDPSQFTCLLAEKGAMDWSEARKDRQSFYRAYCDQNGSNCHAPFQMAVPIHLASSPLTIQIKARPDSREKVYLEYFDGTAYKRLGQIHDGTTRFEFQLDAAAAPEQPPQEDAPQAPARDDTPPAQDAAAAGPAADPEEAADYQQMQKTNSVYGSQELHIEKLDILNAEGTSTRSFVTGETIRFQIRLNALQRVERFVAVVCIMARSGKVITQLFCKSEDVGIRGLEGETTLEALLSPMRIGEGEYMVSIGIFKQCNMSRLAEEPSFCVADRSLFFKVQQPFGVRKSLGEMLHACTWACGNTHWQFDGTTFKSEDTL